MSSTTLEKLESAAKPRPNDGHWPKPVLPNEEQLTEYAIRVAKDGDRLTVTRLAIAIATLGMSEVARALTKAAKKTHLK